MKTFKLFCDIPLALRRNISLPIAHCLVRTHSTDRYITSFPRSGSTWLRSILAGIIDPRSGWEFDTFNRLLPGVSGRNLPRVWALDHPRIIHSHTLFRKRIPKAVYLVRDGRDSLISLYHFIITRNNRVMPFSEWFDLYCKRWYGPRWDENVESWIGVGRKTLGSNLLIKKFETLKSDPEKTIQEITDFLDLPTPPGIIARALEMTSLQKAIEREIRVVGPISNPDAKFYRGGKSGQWQEYLEKRQYERFMRLSNKALALAGYEV